jgi:hypothetical protein
MEQGGNTMTDKTAPADPLQSAIAKLERAYIDYASIVCLSNEEARILNEAVDSNKLADMQRKNEQLRNSCIQLNNRLLKTGNVLAEAWE